MTCQFLKKKIPTGILIEIVLNLLIIGRRTDILIVLSLLNSTVFTCKKYPPIHLFQQYFIVYVQILHIFCHIYPYIFYTTDIIDGTVLISGSNSLLLIYTNTFDSSVLILYSATLLNSLMALVAFLWIPLNRLHKQLKKKN